MQSLVTNASCCMQGHSTSLGVTVRTGFGTVLKILDLSPGILYEAVYEVKLTKRASGWELPLKLRLSLPNGRVQERQVSLLQKPRGQWMELNVGNFYTEENGETGETVEVCFDLYEHGGHWKSGLVFRGAILRPKS
ncbi:hypothetical protein CRYUN_Cryun16bG0044100 [Craigia yunnanensis]